MSQDKNQSLLEIFVENKIAAEEVHEWLKDWQDDIVGLKIEKANEEKKYVVSACVADPEALDTLLLVLNSTFAAVAVWQVDGVAQEKQQKKSSGEHDELQSDIAAVAKEFLENPRNKLLLSEEIFLKSACYEMQKKVKIDQLRRAIKNYLKGKLSSADQDLYDAAVAVCGEIVRKTFSPDQDEVEYEISWLEEGKGFVAEVRPM